MGQAYDKEISLIRKSFRDFAFYALPFCDSSLLLSVASLHLIHEIGWTSQQARNWTVTYQNYADKLQFKNKNRIQSIT